MQPLLGQKTGNLRLGSGESRGASIASRKLRRETTRRQRSGRPLPARPEHPPRLMQRILGRCLNRAVPDQFCAAARASDIKPVAASRSLWFPGQAIRKQPAFIWWSSSLQASAAAACLTIGSVRCRSPVAAKIALASAGAAGGRPGSPSPPQGPSLARKCTSMLRRVGHGEDRIVVETLPARPRRPRW